MYNSFVDKQFPCVKLEIQVQLWARCILACGAGSPSGPNTNVADIQHPCHSLEQGPSLFQKLRKQVRTEGYSTIEALIALFEVHCRSESCHAGSFFDVFLVRFLATRRLEIIGPTNIQSQGLQNAMCSR